MTQKSFSALRKKLASEGSELLCSEINLMSASPTHPKVSLVSGPGRILFPSDGTIKFEVQARLSEEQKSAILDSHLTESFRLVNLYCVATCYDGSSLSGWVDTARLGHGNVMNMKDVRIVGSVTCLLTMVAVEPSTPHACVVYSEPPPVPLSTWRQVKTTHGNKTESLIKEAAGHFFQTQGTSISVLKDSITRELEIVAQVGEGPYAHPSLESLLTEPFRAMHGGYYYPRYILRNFGDGSGQLRIFPTARITASLGGAVETFQMNEAEIYWKYFSKYLDYAARNYNGMTYGSPTKLTHFHDEVNNGVQGGSHWVASLAISSAVEGICKLRPEWVYTKSPVAPEVLEAVSAYVKTIESQFLRQQITNTLNNAARDITPKCSEILKLLVTENLIQKQHKKAWDEFRNFVMHGNLLGYDEPDRRLIFFADLYELLQLLTIDAIGLSAKEFHVSAASRAALEAYSGIKTS